MGSCFDSSRNHQPIAFWMNHSGSSASLEAQPSIRSGARPFLVQGKVKTRAARLVQRCWLAIQDSTSSSRRGSAKRQRDPTDARLSATAQPSRSATRVRTNFQSCSVAGIASNARIRAPRSLSPKRVRAKDAHSTPEAFVEEGLSGSPGSRDPSLVEQHPNVPTSISDKLFLFPLGLDRSGPEGE